jgi:hypothetical protein
VTGGQASRLLVRLFHTEVLYFVRLGDAFAIKNVIGIKDNFGTPENGLSKLSFNVAPNCS